MVVLSNIKVALKTFPRVYRFAQDYYPYFTLLKAAVQGRQGWQEHMKSTWSRLRRDVVIKGRPMNITIEPTNICNLLCPICETGAGILNRDEGHMTLKQFKSIIDKVGVYANTLMFYFMGEPFLNKESYEMIRYAKDVGIPFITTCTNGDPVNPEKLIECGLDEVNFQIGGMTQETHEIYRVNSNIDRVLAGLKETIHLKQVHNSKIRIIAGFIVMKHNEHEVEEFKLRMSELGVDGVSIVNPCVRNISQGKKFLPEDKKYWDYNIEEFKNGNLKPNFQPKNKCDWIYYSLSIHVNGDVVPCCRDPKGEMVMGNLLNQELDEVWNGKSYVAFRETLLKNQSELELCRLCSSCPTSQIQ
jgi:radical SAM protein with 4Fe4S-binding SPASM domain